MLSWNDQSYNNYTLPTTYVMQHPNPIELHDDDNRYDPQKQLEDLNVFDTNRLIIVQL